MTAPHPLTLADAARLARVEQDEIRDALAAGDLRNLSVSAVQAWARARIAAHVARSVKP